jgi:hypothetical protein
MEVNYTLIEKIRQYYAGELSKAEDLELERLFESDETYIWHHNMFRTIGEGIKSSGKQEKRLFKDLDQIEDIELLQALKNKDKRANWLRKALWLTPVVVLVGVLAYLGFQNSNSSTIEEQPSLINNQPVAEDQSNTEAEELFGSTGKKTIKTLPILEYDEVADTYQQTDATQVLILRKRSSGEDAYFYEGDTLQVLLSNYEKLKEASINIVQIKNGLQLRIENKIYDISESTNSPSPLKLVE